MTVRSLFGETPAPTLAALVQEGTRIINAGFEHARASVVIGCLSGGRDSVSACEIASRHPKFGGVLHVNTGIGVKRTRAYCRTLCEQRGWPFYELHPPNLTYEDLVLKYGFPGPAAHRFMYSWLKERAVRQFVTRIKADRLDHVVLATGVRRGESTRRMGTTRALTQDGARVWVAPIIGWTKDQTRTFMAESGLPTNPVVEELGMSGECLCGAFAAPGELDRIADVCPETYAQIVRLEERAERAGLHCSWEDRPPKTAVRHPGQPALFAPLCHGCETQAAWDEQRTAAERSLA